ncbi:alpha-L-rhamnosidase [Sphingomonas sp.]|uniref:alpha-L-rhamnosidase n=1 Tax=Sphingomonas sp. TaxID=28214 RepID=UPI0025DC1627|nr:alpha-L-rhamnosidase [Sphingomonas sp.]
MEIRDLRIEMRTDPLGLDVREPRFSWKLRSETRGARQTAYQLQIAGSPAAFDGSALLFDSGKLASDQSHLIDYEGPALASRDRRFWRVRVWDETDAPTSWSDIAQWEMALLEAEDWKACWISPPGQERGRVAEPPTLFRKEFEVRAGLVSARLYATAQGLYEAEINGGVVGDLVLAPGWTSYRHRIQYQIYDVTAQIRQGPNVIGATLADGWFRGPLFADKRWNCFGTRTALLMQLELTYEDGTNEVVVTDPSWKCSTGPILMSEICAGETYDARLELPGWSAAGFDDAAWQAADELGPNLVELIAQNGSPLRRIGEIQPVEVTTAPSGATIVDFGQNMVGWVKVAAQGEAGHVITLRHGEVLTPEGELYTANLRSAEQTCTYTLKGTGEEVFEPRFTFQGFRFVEVAGIEAADVKSALRGIVMHSDMAHVGHFETSDPLLNQLQSNILWGQKDNFIDIPLDCPQRDERLGWTGDAQVFAPTSAFNMDVSHFFAKWLADVALEQAADGGVPWVVPSVFGNNGACGWGDVATFVPMVLYRQYGDKRLLEAHYPMMQKWVGYMAEKAGAEHIWSGDFQFGDWLDFFSSTRGTDHGMTSEDLIATAFFARSTWLTAEAANVLGRDEEAESYRRSFERIRAAYCERFVSSEGLIGEDTQAAYAISLQFDLLEDEELQRKAAARLAGDVNYRGHLTTGFLATPLLLDALMRYGYQKEAFYLLQRREFPSWLYPVTKGATTIWERWDGIKPDGSFGKVHMNSFNHYAYGAVGDWMYRTIGGLAVDPAQPGFKRFLAAPRPGGDLSSAELRYAGPYGQIELKWRADEGRMTVALLVPPNSVAGLRLPGAAGALVEEGGRPIGETGLAGRAEEVGGDLAFELEAGRYAFSYALSALAG